MRSEFVSKNQKVDCREKGFCFTIKLQCSLVNSVWHIGQSLPHSQFLTDLEKCKLLTGKIQSFRMHTSFMISLLMIGRTSCHFSYFMLSFCATSISFSALQTCIMKTSQHYLQAIRCVLGIKTNPERDFLGTFYHTVF